MTNSAGQSKPAVAVVGASGYTGELLVKLLLRHPHVRLAAVTSRQHAGKPVEAVIPALRGFGGGLVFTASNPEELAADDAIDLFFLALPHGVAHDFAKPLVAAGRRVIDLSADFRLSSADLYQDYYGTAHPCPELLSRAAYVLPEYAPADWKSAPLVAAPGCYPTSILLPLLPLLRTGAVKTEGIVVNSSSGVSGAGKKIAEDYLFCERAESAKAYGLPKHRHLSEIEEQLALAAGRPVVIQFTPHLSPMKRGIITTIVAPSVVSSVEEIYAVWRDLYENTPFVQLLPSGQTPDSQHVVGTNRIDMSAVLDPRTRNVVITSAEDNLMKGAAGQAVQIMNLWNGFPEEAGLQ